MSRPYAIVAGLIFLAFIPVITQLPSLPDLWLHAATIEQLRADFLSLTDPMVDVPGIGNPYFSPYLVFWAADAIVTGLGTFTVLKIAALINIVLLLIGVGLSTRTQSSKPSAPVSTFAVAQSLLVWTMIIKLLRRTPEERRWWPPWAVVGALAGIILLTHQFTAMGAAIACLFFLLDERRTVGRQQLLGSLLSTGAVVAMVVIWPWYSVVNSSTRAELVNRLHARLYQQPFAEYGLLLIAIPVLVYRLFTRLTDAMTLTVIACFAIFVFGAGTGAPYSYPAAMDKIFSSRLPYGPYEWILPYVEPGQAIMDQQLVRAGTGVCLRALHGGACLAGPVPRRGIGRA